MRTPSYVKFDAESDGDINFNRIKPIPKHNHFKNDHCQPISSTMAVL